LYEADCYLSSAPDFLHPQRYLCAALALARLGDEEGLKKVSGNHDIIMQLKQACLDAVLEDEGVRKSAKWWFSSIGRQIRL